MPRTVRPFVDPLGPIFVLLLLIGFLPGPLRADPGTEPLPGEAPTAERTDAYPKGPATRARSAEVTLDDIVVQAEREGPSRTDTSLVRIDREDVEGSASKSVAEALQRDPSILRFRNSRGEQSILMRGFDQRQILVLLDGVPLYDAYDRMLDLGKIPMGPMDGITLVKGAGSVAYGPNGLGGAINIRTRKPGEGPLLEGEFAASPADDAYRFRLGSDVQWKSFGSHVDFGAVTEDGWHLSDRFSPTPVQSDRTRLNSDTKNFHLSGKTAWDLSDSHSVQAGGFFLKGEWGVPPNVYSRNPRYWRWNHWETVNGHLGHAGRYGAFSMEEMFYVNLNTNELDSYDDDTYSTQTTQRAFHSRHEDSTYGITLRPAYVFDPFSPHGKAYARAWVGARYDRHRERASPEAPEAIFSVFTLTLAPELELQPWEKVSFIAGLQADIEIPEALEGFDPESTWHLGPMFQVLATPTESLFLRLQATERARFPTLKERYASSIVGRIPNPELRPERAWNLGLDAGVEKGAVRLVAGVFYSDVRDLIEQSIPAGGVEKIENIGGVTYLGTEALLEWTLGRGFRVHATYAFLHCEREGSDETRLPYRPAHKGSVGLSYAWRDRMDASTTVRAVSSQDFQDPDTGRWGRLGPYALWDVFLRVRPIRNLSLWLNVENLLDGDSQNAYGFPEPGRTYWIGLQAHTG